MYKHEIVPRLSFRSTEEYEKFSTHYWSQKYQGRPIIFGFGLEYLDTNDDIVVTKFQAVNHNINHEFAAVLHYILNGNRVVRNVHYRNLLDALTIFSSKGANVNLDGMKSLWANHKRLESKCKGTSQIVVTFLFEASLIEQDSPLSDVVQSRIMPTSEAHFWVRIAEHGLVIKGHKMVTRARDLLRENPWFDVNYPWTVRKNQLKNAARACIAPLTPEAINTQFFPA